jgi:uncharacterized protein (TIGR04255 family)
MEKRKKEIPILLNPPLIEAIFELHWELQGDKQTGRMRDPSYPMMYGRLYERLKNDFPFIEDLPSVQMHPEATPYIVRHRMRKEKMGYPLIQVGPGIATVNFAQGYSWTQFRKHILSLYEGISDLFPTPAAALNFTKCELRYLNGIRLDGQPETPLAFLAQKLHTKVEVDPELFILNQMADQPQSMNLSLGFPLRKPVGTLGVSVHLGQMDGKKAYLLQTQIVSAAESIPADSQGMTTWANDAHETAVNSFISLCKGPLMDKFCGG